MYVRSRCFLSVWLALLGTGCAYKSTASSPSQARPGRAVAENRNPTSAVVEPNGVVTLNDAVRFALINHPTLRAFPWEQRAAEARTLQASLLPNPELEVEIEEFGGTSNRRGFDGAETSIQLGQLIELGGKRAKRMKLAGIERDLIQSGYESKKLDVMYDVTIAFVEVLATQEQLALARELVGLSEKTYGAVEQRVAAGKDAPVEQAKAKVVVAKARLELARAERRLASAQTRLALAWGSTAPRFRSARGDFYRVSPVPLLDELTDLITDNPDLSRWDTEIRRRHATLELERAKRIPDVGMRGGLLHFNEGDDTAFIAGLSIPLPAFNRNQGGIEAAGQMLAKTRDDRQAAEMNVRTALARAIEGASIAFTEAGVLKDEVLPAAQSAYEAADEGYRQGKFDYLDVLDAQRTLFEARVQYVSSLTMYHQRRAAIERLIGRSVPEPRLSATAITTPKPLSEELSDEK